MSVYYIAGIPYSDELYHYGILGQKWGIRRFQNPDGTYTDAGKRRYGVKSDRQANALAKYQDREYNRAKLYYESREKALGNKVVKLQNKLDKTTNPNKAVKIAEKINEVEREYNRTKELNPKILKGIANMKVHDMRREQLIKAASAVDSLILSSGTLALGVATVGPAAQLSLLGAERAANIMFGTGLGLGTSTSIFNAASAGKISRSRLRKYRERRAI